METLERLAGKLARDLNRLDSAGCRREDVEEISAKLVMELTDQLDAVEESRRFDSEGSRRAPNWRTRG